MGTTQAVGFAESVNEGLTSLDQALNYHLFTNHFPRLPRGALALSLRAIRLWKCGFYKAAINVSSIGEHRRHELDVPINTILEEWHLEPFVASENPGDDEIIWDIEYPEAEEMDGDPFYDLAVRFVAELIKADIVADEFKNDYERLLRTAIGYCGGYSDDPPSDLFAFEFVTSAEGAEGSLDKGVQAAWEAAKAGVE